MRASRLGRSKIPPERLEAFAQGSDAISQFGCLDGHRRTVATLGSGVDDGEDEAGITAFQHGDTEARSRSE
jgi:hypothetical protein